MFLLSWFHLSTFLSGTVLTVVFLVVIWVSSLHQGSPPEERTPKPSPAPATKLALPTGTLFRLPPTIALSLVSDVSTFVVWCFSSCNFKDLLWRMTKPLQHQSHQLLLQVASRVLQDISMLISCVLALVWILLSFLKCLRGSNHLSQSQCLHHLLLVQPKLGHLQVLVVWSFLIWSGFYVLSIYVVCQRIYFFFCSLSWSFYLLYLQRVVTHLY